MFNLSCGISFGFSVSRALSLGDLLPGRDELDLLSDMTLTESVACTRAEMLGILWAAEVSAALAFGLDGLGEEV